MKLVPDDYVSTPVPAAVEPEVPAAKINGETLVISAVINSGDAGALTTFGVQQEHFVAYPQEFSWLVAQIDSHDQVPSRDAFRGRWPNFPLNRHEDVRMAVDQLLEHWHKAQGKQILLSATSLLAESKLTEAFEEVQRFRPVMTAAKPVNIMNDTSFLDQWAGDGDYGKGIPLPYAPFQHATSGIRSGNYGIIAARTNQGKTSHALNFVKHALINGKNVLYYSLEMTEAEMRAKLHASLASELGLKGITATKILNRDLDRDLYKELLEMIDQQSHWGEIHVHTPRQGIVTPAVLHSRLGDYDLGVIDLITLMANRRGEQSINDWRIAASISNDVKQIALEVDTAVWATAQINRQGDFGDKPPSLGNLAQTDSLAQDADLVVTARAIAHGKVSALSLEKNRHGPKATCYTTFEPDRGVYKVITRETAEEIAIEEDARARAS